MSYTRAQCTCQLLISWRHVTNTLWTQLTLPTAHPPACSQHHNHDTQTHRHDRVHDWHIQSLTHTTTNRQRWADHNNLTNSVTQHQPDHASVITSKPPPLCSRHSFAVLWNLLLLVAMPLRVDFSKLAELVNCPRNASAWQNHHNGDEFNVTHISIAIAATVMQNYVYFFS